MENLILKVLILGGTNFLGPHLVEELHNHGHQITLFNRGTQTQDMFPFVEKLQGDRDGDLNALMGRKWDAIIDTSGHLPRIVEISSKTLANSTNHYTFISTIGVYQDFHASNIDEQYPLAELEDESSEEINDKTYGALKAGCEKVVQNYFPNHSLIIRSGLIVGPNDPTGRFSYWPRRIAQGGAVLAPGKPNQPIQYIDVRDLARWIVRMIENQATGIYNATGPQNLMTLEDLLKACQKVSKTDVGYNWADEDFLLKNNVQDWVDLPLWLSSKRNMPGFLVINAQKALHDGLVLRPVSETIAAILDWDRTREPLMLQTGLLQEREKQLLELWKQYRTNPPPA